MDPRPRSLWPLAGLGAAILLVGIIVGTALVSKPARADSNFDIASALAKLAPMWPHSSSDVINVRGRAIDDDEKVDFSQDVGTTTVNAMGDSATTGTAEATNEETTSQMFRCVNEDTTTTDQICIGIIDRGAGTCAVAAAAVGAGAFTCGAANPNKTNGTPLFPSHPPFNITILGTECLILEAKTASTPVTCTRVARKPNQ